MDFFEYINWMFTAGTTASYIALGVAGFFAVSVLSELLAGLKRGAVRQIAHIGFTAIAFIASFFVTQHLLLEMHVMFENYTIEEMLVSMTGGPLDENTGAVIDAIEGTGNLPELLLTLPAATLLAPIVFVVLFYAINLILKILCFIITRFIKKGEGAGSRLFGLVIGAAEGLLVATLVCVPVVAIADVCDGVYAELDESAAELPREVDTVYADYIKPLGEHPFLSLTRMAGGDAMIDSFAKVDLGFGELDMREELYSAVHIFSGIAGLGEADFSKLEGNEKELISAMIDGIAESEYFSEIFVGVFGFFGDMYEEEGNNALVGEDSGDLLAALLDDVIVILGSTTKDTLGEDLNTFKDMFFILSDGDVLVAFDEGLSEEAMLAVLNTKDENGKTVISKLIDTLQANERTAAIVTTITKLSISIMAEQMGIDENVEAIYEGVKDGLGDIADIDRESYSTEEEYKAAVKDSISSTLTTNGITLEDDVVEEMADYAADNYGELEELSEEEINDILLQYYEASLAQ